MKKNLTLLSLLLCSSLSALPFGEDVKAGEATFYSNDKTLSIITSEKTIINYQEFNIGQGEVVQFIQPSANSSVLNRVTGGNCSEILGRLESNGQVFLVNAQGIYFGPDAIVNVGSIVATSLSIRDDFFLQDSLEFFLENKTSGSIVNEGMILADGFAALFAPTVQNQGSIYARAGQVFLGASEKVILDLMGDGLIKVLVEGDLEKALIENYGKIEAIESNVLISLKVARRAIENLVNTDGIQVAMEIEESNGLIRLVGSSKIIAQNVKVEGEKVDSRGMIDVSRSQEGQIGGMVELLGNRVELWGSQIEASGDAGGGTVLIGGDYQGKGLQRNAQFTLMDELSIIQADAYTSGNGGKVILWSDDTTLFDGKIYARGGKESGNGGFVETSGKENLGVGLGYVNTSAPKGSFGDWLLDPSSITISAAGAGTIASASAPNCATTGIVSISTATLVAATTNVALCAQNTASSSITVSSSFIMGSGVSLSMTAGSSNTGSITLSGNISTRGQPISLTGVVTLGAPVMLDTTNGGLSQAGANITFSNTINGTAIDAQGLTLNSGTTGVITFSGALGGTTRLGPVLISSLAGSSAVSLGGNITANSFRILNAVPLTLTANSTINTSASNGIISFGGTINGTTPGTQSLTLNAGTAGPITLSGALGGSIRLSAVLISSAVGSSTVSLANNITANSFTITNAVPVTLTGASTINTSASSGAISFGGTIDGAQNLTLNSGLSGTITFSGALGGTTRLGAVLISSTPGLSNTVSLANNITASSFTITNAIPVTLTGASIINTSLSSGAISFGGTINGSQNLTLNAGTAGAITFSGALGGTTPLGAVLISSSAGSSAVSLGGSITANSFRILNAVPLTLTANSTINTSASSGAISFGGTINGTQNLTLNAGTAGAITLSGALGGTIRLRAVLISSAVGSSTVSLANNITASSFTITNAVPVTLTGSSTINTSASSGAISFGGTIDGAQNLTLNAGTAGAITLSSALGGTTPLGAVLISSAVGSSTVSLANNITASSFTITNAVPVTLTGASIINTSGSNGAISFGGTINGTQNLTLNAGTSGATTFSRALGGSTPLGALLISSGTGSTVSLANNITASSFEITNAVPVTLTGASIINTSGSNGAISFGGTINGTQNLTLNAGTSGAITFSRALGGSTPLGALLISSGTGSTVSLANNITASSFEITNAVPVTLTGASTINTSASSGAISFGGTIDGAQNLTLNAGTAGAITLSSALGGTTPLGAVLISSAVGSSTVSLANNITASSFTITNAVPVTLTGASIINTSGSNGAISFGGTINGTQNLTLNAGASGAITFSRALGGSTTLGALLISSGTGSTVSIANNITASSFEITNAVPVTLTGASIINTSGSNGAISFGGTINGTQNLTLNAGASGTITFSRALGGSTTLGALLISSGTGSTVSIANNITASSFEITNAVPVTLTGDSTINTSANNGAISFGGTIDGAQNLTLNAGTGIVTITGNAGEISPLTSLMVTGNTINQNGAVTTSGAVTYINTGILSLSSTITAGSLNQSGGGNVILSSNINTTSSIYFTNDITSTTNITMSSSGAGGITLIGSLIPDVDNIYDITLTATAGSLTTHQLGAPLEYINVATLTGNPFTPLGNIYANTIITNGSSIIDGNITAPGAELVFYFPVAVSAGSFTIDTTGGSEPGSVTFESTLDGPGSLDFILGSGNLTFNAAVGGITPFGDALITSVQDMTLSSGFIGSSLVQSSGTGTTTTNGSIRTNSSTGVSLTGNIFSINGSITTTAVGPISFTNSGALTISSTISSNGVVSQNGTGVVFLGGEIITTNATAPPSSGVSFVSPITLLDHVNINTTTGGGIISFGALSTINGYNNLSLAAAAGNITLNATLGGLKPLNIFTISSAGNLTLPDIFANSFTQSSGTGTTTLNGDMNTTSSAGVVFVTNILTINGSITTLGRGPVIFQNTGLLTISPGSTINAGGPFTQRGAGPVSVSGNVISHDDPRKKN